MVKISKSLIEHRGAENAAHKEEWSSRPVPRLESGTRTKHLPIIEGAPSCSVKAEGFKGYLFGAQGLDARARREGCASG
jgi:hypothetical protein